MLPSAPYMRPSTVRLQQQPLYQSLDHTPRPDCSSISQVEDCPPTLDSLPTEVLVHILSIVDSTYDLGRASCVCRALGGLVEQSFQELGVGCDSVHLDYAVANGCGRGAACGRWLTKVCVGGGTKRVGAWGRDAVHECADGEVASACALDLFCDARVAGVAGESLEYDSSANDIVHV